MMLGESPRRLTLSMGGSPMRILIERFGVDDDVWDEIALIVAEEQPRPGRPMTVRPDVLSARRRSLQGALARYRIALVPDSAVRRFLERLKSDDRAVQAALQADRSDRASVTHDAVAGSLNESNGYQLRRNLHPFQQRDLIKLAALSHGANFSVPGAGKTTVTLALHLEARRTHGVNQLVVVGPLSAFGAWEEEAAAVVEPPMTVGRWQGGPIPERDIILINYQRLPNARQGLSSLMMRKSVHLVVDEAHRAKRGAAGGWGRALLELAPLAVRRDILTGTPAPNHPKDLRALLDILWPNGHATRLLPDRAFMADPPMDAMAAVNRAIGALYVRTTKQELGLPAVKFEARHVRLGHLQKSIYDAMLNRYAGMFDLNRRDRAMFAQMGEVVMYLLQAACSPKLLSATADASRAYRYPPLAIPLGSRLATLVDAYGDYEVPAKIKQTCAIVRANAIAGNKTLVWSNFPRNLLTLEQQLAALSPALVYGAIPSDEDAEAGVRTRERELDRFRDDPRCMVLLANPAAMSEGVSLHHVCHHAIYVDRTFNAGQYLQSLDRIHRLGLAPNIETRVTLLIAEGTIDERVNRRVEEKTRRLARMLADAALTQMALPDEDDYGDPVDDPDDLEEILRHLREAPSVVMDDDNA